LPFLLLGHHRSGSSFINSLVRSHPHIESINEPFSQHLDVFRQVDFIPWAAEEFSEECLHPCITPHGETDAYLRDLRKWLLAPGDVIRGFKETTLFEKIPWLMRLLGPLPAILLTRDPRAIVNSIVRRRMHESWWNYRQRLETYVATGGHIPDGTSLDDPISLTAAIWSIRMELGLCAAQELGWLIIRLEDLVQDAETWLPRMMNFLGTEAHSRQWDFLNDSWKETRGGTYSSRREPRMVLEHWRETLSYENQRTIESIAWRPMAQLRYT